MIQIRFLRLCITLTITSAATALAQTTPSTAPTPTPGRVKMTLNDGWRFIGEGRQDADNPNQDDSAWLIIDVPHTWNAFDPFDDAPGYRRGQSWYRRPLTIDPQLKDKRLFLFFEGVHQNAEVWINGRRAGQHRGGYTGFCFDVTKLLKSGDNATNLLAVRADSSLQEDIAPLDIGFAHYGGIYRDVWLIATDAVHFEMTDHASAGVRVDTPQVTAERATVRVRGTVVNDTDKERRVAVRLALTDPSGKPAGNATAGVKIPASGKTEFEQKIELAQPSLWSPDTPNLYNLVATIQDGERVLDGYSTHVGLRWFKFDAKEGFSLNGKRLPLRGASRHQDYANLGSALPNSIHRSDLQWIKDMGGNFVRLAHYPQDPEVLETADRIGLIVWEEIPIVSTMSASPQFAETSRNMLLDMIRQHYNHPSVVMWGYMNETLLNWGRTANRDPQFPAQVKELATELEAIVRREDPTRVTTMAMNQGASYDDSGISDIPQVAGWNLYTGWYHGVFDDFGKYLDRQHEKFPNRVLFVSEYGAGSDERLHSLKPRRFDHSCEWMQMYHEAHLHQIAARPWLSGVAIWNEFDFSQPEAGDSIPHMNQKGMLTFDRRPKDVYYLYQANWSDKPMVHIATREWLRRSGAGDSPVKIYSNCDSVELFLDGKSLAAKKPDDVKSAIWQVPLHAGWNLLEARAMRGDAEVRDSVRVHFTRRAEKLADPSVPFEELAVNAGANVSYTDPQGLIWEADQKYHPGGWGYVGGIDQWESIKGDTRLDILDTTEDPLYQALRGNPEAYRFDVPDGEYDLELRFTEYFDRVPGFRSFRVTCNGQTLIDKLDLAAQYGVRRAVARTFKLRATDGKGLHIRFESIVGRPIISALRVRRVDGLLPSPAGKGQR